MSRNTEEIMVLLGYEGEQEGEEKGSEKGGKKEKKRGRNSGKERATDGKYK